MKILALAAALLSLTACRDAAGPSGGESPGGAAVVWFNGLSATADAWYPEADSLITGAWSTGSAPNQIMDLGGGVFGVLSSVSAEFLTASVEEPGSGIMNVLLPQGTNPYCFAVSGSTCFVTLLLADSVVEFSLDSGAPVGGFSTRSNPSGIECRGDRVFVGYADWPDGTSPGGVSVYNMETGLETAWLDTGVNTSWLKLQPSGMLHCYSTTYQDDGRITVVDPTGDYHTVCVINCGGAPGEAVQVGNGFISPDGWGQGGVVIYQENGGFQREELPFAPSGLAFHGGVLYATCFGGGRVYMLDPGSLSVTDSLQSGGEGPQGIVAVDPGS